MRVGLDVGSTTIKCVVLDDRDNLIYSTYERHYTHIVEKSAELLHRIASQCGQAEAARLPSPAPPAWAWLGACRLPFVQEVFATRVAANRLAPGTDVVIELGGRGCRKFSS